MRTLCSRCGAVIDEEMAEDVESMELECPECGLGVTVVRLLRSDRKSKGWFGSPLRQLRGYLLWRRSRQGLLADEARDRQERAAVLRGCPFPPYGLDQSWIGRRWFGGWGGSSDDRLTRITLSHGDAWDEGSPLVRVETYIDDENDPMLRVTAAQDLAFGLFSETGEHLDQIRDTFRSSDPTASWALITIDLQGRPLTFKSLSTGSSWVALGEPPGYLVAIEARHMGPDQVHLTVIDDRESYLAGDGGPR